MFQELENKVLEKQVLFRSRNDADLYGVLYRAQGEEEGAMVICPPDGEERIWSQRILVNFSRLLAVHGYTVFRFDYMGQGESEGNYEESNLSTRHADIESAIGFLLGQTKSNSVGLLGVRLGGTLASWVASKDSAVKCLILWEPILDLRGYFYNLLRVNISFQMVMHKMVSKNREKLVEEILGGGEVSINGFNLTQALLKEAMEIKPEGFLNKFSGKLLITLLPGSKLPVEHHRGEVVGLEFPVFWKEPKIYCTRPKTLMDETLKWMGQNWVAGGV